MERQFAVVVHGDCPDFRGEVREYGTVPLAGKGTAAFSGPIRPEKMSQSATCGRLPSAQPRNGHTAQPAPGAANRTPRAVLWIVLGIALAAGPSLAWAQADPKPSPAAPDQLAVEQQRLSDRFKRFEELLLRMAELSAATDPRRAALLRKAVAQSKERLIGVQMETLVELLRKDELGRALENQQAVEKDLLALLDLLLSENRAKRLQSEKARIREYLKRLSALINQQKDIQGRTSGGGEPKALAEEQARVADKAGGLAKEIQKNEEDLHPETRKGQDNGNQGLPEKQPQGGEPKPGSQGPKPDAQGKTPAKPPGPKPAEAQGQPKDQGASKPDGQVPSSPPDSPPATQDHPARKRLEAAESRMREAENKLQEAQRQGAFEKQEEAIRELEQARSALEQILRQLREEEIQRVLVSLEARFTKMLQMQREVLDGTVRLDKIPPAERTREHEIQAGRLGSREGEIDLEAEKALTLIREDGSAMALAEALGQVRQDIQQVADRLSAAKVDKITQGLEEDVIAALDEMLQALKKAIKDQEKRKQRPTPFGQGVPSDPPLIDVLAELRMIRTLQLRVNLRTDRYSKLIQGEQAEQPDLIDALKRLAERQEHIFRITRDLSLGKNQ